MAQANRLTRHSSAETAAWRKLPKSAATLLLRSPGISRKQPSSMADTTTHSRWFRRRGQPPQPHKVGAGAARAGAAEEEEELQRRRRRRKIFNGASKTSSTLRISWRRSTTRILTGPT